MLCLVCYFFVISTSVIDCLGRSVPEMTYYVLSGTLNLAQLKLMDIDSDNSNDIDNDAELVYRVNAVSRWQHSDVQNAASNHRKDAFGAHEYQWFSLWSSQLFLTLYDYHSLVCSALFT